ncbi:MAG: HD domain-containing protein [Gammaproteobacteria bacterium]
MQDIKNMYQFILELNKLKLVFRNTTTEQNRKESTAEHSWSVSMIVITLMNPLKKGFGEIDER